MTTEMTNNPTSPLSTSHREHPKASGITREESQLLCGEHRMGGLILASWTSEADFDDLEAQTRKRFHHFLTYPDATRWGFFNPLGFVYSERRDADFEFVAKLHHDPWTTFMRSILPPGTSESPDEWHSHVFDPCPETRHRKWAQCYSGIMIYEGREVAHPLWRTDGMISFDEDLLPK